MWDYVQRVSEFLKQAAEESTWNEKRRKEVKRKRAFWIGGQEAVRFGVMRYIIMWRTWKGLCA